MGSSALNPVPTLREELDRKVFETIEWLFLSIKNRRISEYQFSTAIDALFMATAGLVEGSYMDLVTSASAECPKAPETLKKVFVKETDVLVVSWEVGSDLLKINLLREGLSIGGVAPKLSANSEDAYRRFQALTARVLTEGWAEI